MSHDTWNNKCYSLGMAKEDVATVWTVLMAGEQCSKIASERPMWR